jgi:hypothetical protein
MKPSYAATLALLLTVGGTGVLGAGPGDSAMDAFLIKLQQAVDAHDVRGVASLVGYPLTVVASGFQLPFADAPAFIKSYDAIFTPVFRCSVSRSLTAREVSINADGVSIASGGVWAARKGTDVRITRILQPSIGAVAPRPPASRPVTFSGRPAQFLGRLERDDHDTYIVDGKAGQRLDVEITGFRGRDAGIRVLDQKSSAPIDTKLHVGPRSWAGVLPSTGAYRVEVLRLAPYCDPALQYQITLTLARP